MGKVDCLQVAGCECWFYSRDHPPEHFHAASPGEWEVRVLFLRQPIEIEVVYEIRKIPRSVLESLRRVAGASREDLFVEWSQKVNP